MTETRDQRAERLVRIGLDAAVRIRDEDPAAVARALEPLDRAELRDLVLLLAAAVDVDRPAAVLFGWLGIGGCGSQRAVSRHRLLGEKLDRACLDFDANRKRRERAGPRDVPDDVPGPRCGDPERPVRFPDPRRGVA